MKRTKDLNVFRFINYRKYLDNFYKVQKRNKPPIGYRELALMIGAFSCSFYHEIVKGKRDLTRTYIWRIAEMCKFNTLESMYFESMVYWDQATNRRERKYYLEHMRKIKEVGLKKATAS